MIILVGGETLSVRATANTVGDALAEIGLGLQGLDYSIPGESSAIPADRKIEIVQVREEINIEQVPLPFETEFQPDPTLEIELPTDTRTRGVWPASGARAGAV